MSLHRTANRLATKGRDGDTMLVHMAPEEVGGLQALALSAYGKPLTVNPDTGLIEASLLKRLLPTLAGAVVGSVIPGANGWVSALAGGIASGAANGWNLKNIGAGMLGGYSGRELANRLAAVGAAPAATAPKTQPTQTTIATDEMGVNHVMDGAAPARATAPSAAAAASNAAKDAAAKTTATPVKVCVVSLQMRRSVSSLRTRISGPSLALSVLTRLSRIRFLALRSRVTASGSRTSIAALR